MDNTPHDIVGFERTMLIDSDLDLVMLTKEEFGLLQELAEKQGRSEWKSSVPVLMKHPLLKYRNNLDS